jgi:hypothetical protein
MSGKETFHRIVESLKKAKEEFHKLIDEGNSIPPHEGTENQKRNIGINNMIGDIEFVGFYNKLTGQKPHICLDWEKTIELFKGFDFE